jgi:glycosyltransferase involved in cell wall biosynthesis
LKVLYLSNYRDATGYSQAAIDNILALDAAGVDMSIRPIKFNNVDGIIPRRLVELESKSNKNCDIVIQHTLPMFMEYDGRFRQNIAVYCNETTNFINSGWTERLNRMSKAIVPAQFMVYAARASSVNTVISVIPYPSNIDKFFRSYKPISSLPDTFKFYTIGELTRRKNLTALLKAFHTEFGVNEPVSLVIKCNKPGFPPEEVQKHAEAICNEIKAGLKLYNSTDKYKQEIIISGRLSDEDICRLHYSCDCFVSVSYGEAWSIPAFDALGFGKTPIVTNWGGFLEYLTDKTSWLVDCYMESVFGVTDSFDNLYTGSEEWASVSVPHLRKCMREAYENKELREHKLEHNLDNIDRYSYKNVGLMLKRELENE